MSLSKFKLVNEAEDSYHLSGPDGKTFTVDKNKLSSQAQAIIAKMKKMSADSTKDDKMPKKFAEGGMSAEPGQNMTPSSPQTPQQMAEMPLPNNQSTVSQSNQAMDQQRQQEEPGLEESHPEDIAMLAGPIAAKGIRAGAEMAAPLISNEIGAVGADVSQLAAKRGAEHFVEPLSNSLSKVMQRTQNLPNKTEVETVFNNAAHRFMDNLPKSEIEAAKNLSPDELSHFFESSPSFKSASRNLNLQTRRAANPNLPSMTQNSLRTQPKLMAKGGEVQKFAEGTPNEVVQSLMPDLSGQGNQGMALPIKAGDESSNISPQLEERFGSTPPVTNTSNSEFSPEEQQMLSSLKPVNTQPQTNSLNIAPQQPNIQPSMANSPYAALDAASAEKIKDYQGLIDAYSKAGTGVPSDVMGKLKNLKTPEQIMSDYKMKDDQFENALKDPNNQIQPFRLLHNTSTGNKIMAGIGMVLAGIGSGLTGQPNQAIKVVSDAIDKDIDAQKNDQSNRYNLWKMNRERAHSDLEANVMTRNQLLSMANVYAQQQATRLGTVAAKTNAQLAQTATKQELAQNHIVLAALNDNTDNLGGAVPGTEQAFLNKQNSLINASQYSPLLKQKHAENKANYVPGIGVGTVPVSPTDRTDLTNLQSFKNLVGQAKDIQERNPGGIWTNFEDKARANQIFGSILTAAPSMLLDIKRYNPDLADTIATGIKSPSSMDWTGKNAAALSQLQDFAGSRIKDKSRSLGIKPFATAPQDQIALKWVQDNPNDPKAAEVKQRLRQNGAL